MKVNQWSLGLAASGLISLPLATSAEEQLSPVMSALSSTTISGYVNTSAHWNPGSGNVNSPAFSFNNGKQDGFNLDVVKLALEKPLDEGQWAAGYKVETLFGEDANLYATQSSGLAGDFGLKQAYVALRAPVGNGLDFKLGVWDTVIGYEGFDAGNNPNYTRSYGYTMEPTTHTGLLATYQLNDMIGLSAGVANTFGPRINAKAHPLGTPWVGEGYKAESYKTYLASIAFTAPESFGFLQGSMLYLGAVNGFNGGLSDGQNGNLGGDQSSLYAGATLNTPITGLKVGASFDYVFVDEQTRPGVDNQVPPQPIGPLDSSYASAYGLYASYQLTEKLSLHARGEYASTDTGAFGFADKVIEATGTLQYDLWKNVLTRVEFRWDHAADGDEAFGGSAGNPAKKNAFLVAANVIYKF